MRITILSDESMVVMRRVALAGLAGVAFFSVGAAADPYQPVRASVVAVCLTLVLLTSVRPRGASARLPLVALAVLVAWSLASALAAHPASSVLGVHGRYQGVLSLVLFASAGVAGWVWAGRDIKWLAMVAAVASTAQVAVVVYQFLVGTDPVGTFGNRVLLGAWLAVISAITLAGARVTSSTERWLLLASSSLSAVGLGLAGSRGAWVGLVAVAVFFLVTSRPKNSLPILAAAALVVVVAAGSGGEVARKLDPASLLSGSAASRWEIWKSAGEMIADRPVFGVGPGRFLYEYPAYESVEHARLEGPDVRPDQAHGHLIQIAAESGVVPAAAALGLIVLAGVAAVRGARRGDGASMVAGAAFAAFVGQGLFGISAVETDAIGWLAGGVLIARAAASPSSDKADRVSGAEMRGHESVRMAGAAVAVAIAIASAYYISADLEHRRGAALFEEARFADALVAQEAAVRRNPLVDVYRVGESDPALYLDGPAKNRALDTIEAGLDLEPMSFDLALARARVLAAIDRDSPETLDAYEKAVELYPLGATVRLETTLLLLDAGRVEDAGKMAEDVLVTWPEDSQIRDIVEDIIGGA